MENLKLTFDFLSPAEKIQYWKARIALVTRNSSFNKSQLKLANELTFSIRETYFEDGGSAEVDKFSRMWFQKASQIFSSKELAMLTLLTPINVENGQANFDFMTTDSDPRDDGLKCKCLVDATINHCQFYGRSCIENTGCEVQPSGCGFMGGKKCDGRCDGW
ncbi:MAG: bacteriocin fulvocin C-related protein [Chitinophagaceae bacterium]|nr:bacteriocin fulvocin C-related protein [Chitinophagaceae bacterium]